MNTHLYVHVYGIEVIFQLISTNGKRSNQNPVELNDAVFPSPGNKRKNKKIPLHLEGVEDDFLVQHGWDDGMCEFL